MPGFTCILPFDGKVNVLVCWQFEIMVFEILLSQRTRGFLIPHSLRAFVPDTKGKREMYLSRRVSLLHLFYPLVPVPLASRRLSGTDFDQPPEVTAADGREKKPGLRNIPNHQVGFLPLFQGGIACFAKIFQIMTRKMERFVFVTTMKIFTLFPPTFAITYLRFEIDSQTQRQDLATGSFPRLKSVRLTSSCKNTCPLLCHSLLIFEFFTVKALDVPRALSRMEVLYEEYPKSSGIFALGNILN